MTDNFYDKTNKKLPFVLIVVPNKDGVNHLVNSLESISNLEYQNFKVVVVDNCSHDNSIEYVQTNYPQYEIIQNKIDCGFSGSVNKGLKHALDIKADYVVVFSNDVIVYPLWLSDSINAIRKEPECGIVGFREINDSYKDELLSKPPVIETKYINKPEGEAIYLLKTDIVKKVGPFDENYYMYGEDNDYFYRCMKAGFITLQTNIPIWHAGEGFSQSENKKRIATKYVYRNWLRHAVKNYDIIRQIKALFKMAVYTFLPNSFWKRKNNSSSVNRLVRFNFNYRLQCFFYAIFWNIVNFRKTKLSKLRENEWLEL